MSTRMPPRGRTPQRPAYAPTPPREEFNENGTPKRPRKGFFVMGVVIIALVVIYAVAFTSPSFGSGNAGPTQIGGKTPKPGKTGKADATATATAAPATGNLPEITEVLSSNKGTVTDEAGDYTDWIELYNPTAKTINLAAFALSDNQKKPMKSVLPTYLLEPGKCVVIYADGKDSTKDELHVNFKLKSSGTTLLLVDPNGNAVQSLTVPKMESDHSYAMDMNDKTKWADTDKVTPGFPNTDEGLAAYQQTRRATAPVGLNEVMAGNTMTIKDEDGEYSDWVELYNPTDKPVDLTGWGLSNRESEPKRWVFPKTTLDAGKYLVVFTSGKNRSDEGKELHTNFRLNGFKDTVLLSNLRGQIVSEVQINNLKADTSWGETPGTDKWQEFTHPTPGYPNNEEGWNALQPKLYADEGNTPIEINEVMSNNTNTLKDQFDAYPDWIELYNRSNKSVSLKGWGLTNKSNELGRWKFPDVSVGPGQYLTVFASGKNLKDGDALTSQKLHTDFSIGGSGSILALTAPDGHLADRCFVPPLKVGDSYGREPNSVGFDYITNPTPSAANVAGYSGVTPDPQFSIKAGVYDGDQKVELTAPGAKIYYTTNGDNPSQSSTPYSGPITVTKSDKDLGGTVIRAVAYKDGFLPSNAVCSTYIVSPKINISLPIISLTVDNKAMFDPATGMYSKGNHLTNQKYPFQGADFWKHAEIGAHLELIETDGSVGISQDVGLQIAGQFSRGDAYKGLDVVARSIYGKKEFDYPLFPDQKYTTYKRFVLRPGGQDVKRTGMRDVLISSLARDTIPTNYIAGGPQNYVQDYRTALEFVNGEFWGVTHIREKIDAGTLAQHYSGVDPAKVAILQGVGTTVKAGTSKDSKDFMDLVDYAKSHDLSNADNYKYMTDRMDVDSYINWFTLEFCSGNSDMANIRMWRSPNLDNKWRWIFYDFCWTFNIYTRSDISLDLTGPKTGASSNRALGTALLQNPEFKEKFLKQLAYNINVTFAPDRVLQKIDEFTDVMKPYMAAEDAKWHDISYDGSNATGAQGYAGWDNQVGVLRKYAQHHPELLKQQMKNFFGLSDAKMQELFPNG